MSVHLWGHISHAQPAASDYYLPVLPTEVPVATVSVQDIARHLKCTEDTVRKCVKAGVLPQPIRFSRKLVRFEQAAVDEALKKLAQPPGAGEEE